MILRPQKTELLPEIFRKVLPYSQKGNIFLHLCPLPYQLSQTRQPSNVKQCLKPLVPIAKHKRPLKHELIVVVFMTISYFIGHNNATQNIFPYPSCDVSRWVEQPVKAGIPVELLHLVPPIPHLGDHPAWVIGRG